MPSLFPPTRAVPALAGAALIAALAPAGLLAQDSVRVVTLREAVDRAQVVDPLAAAALSDISSARADLLENNGAWLPSLSLNSTYSNSSNERFDQATGRLSSENYTAQISTSYELFDGGRRFAERRSAHAGIRAAEATHVERRFQAVLAVKTAFYAAAANRELVDAARQRLERARQQLVFARTRLELGTATQSDVLRAEIEVGNAELALVDAEADLRSSRLNLARRMGLQGQVQPAEGSLPATAPALPADEALLARAEERSPAAAAARARLSERRAATTATYSSFAPSLRANFGYDWAAPEFPPSERDWSMRITASLPIFNNFQRETNVTRARALQRAAEAQAADAALGARVLAEDAAREIESAQRRVAIAARSVDLAREDLRVQEERYKLGVATILDLQTSQVALADAQVAHVRARQDLGVAVANLEAVLGEELAAS